MEDIPEDCGAELDETEEDETVYLLRSPKNAERLMAALQEANLGKGKVMTIEELMRSVGLDPSELGNR